ncbi:cupredoxin domain-containing protein [Telmatospirillum sp. J64-1]|uniref:cupredoxin domain-containing protein n=1 Tax=Telmatospirillum sp. J64-1 TaxID=2502183 RepID=UPI00163D58E7|nr:cupredoxin domain-containing protein [Telmatospirillum sp. J64-1]
MPAIRLPRHPFLAAALLLAACTPATDQFTPVEPSRAPAAPAMDFSNAEQRQVNLENYEFQPGELLLNAGQPYRLFLSNPSNSPHTFVSLEFFRAITPHAIDGRPVSSVERIAVAPGQTRVFDFVTGQPGSFPLICTVHEGMGMTGLITVQ